jgi:hypothetical protein
MMTVVLITDALRQANMKVTIHDMGRTNYVDFVLAVIIEEPVDIWYAAKAMDGLHVTASVKGNMLFFPEMKLSAEDYRYICDAY